MVLKMKMATVVLFVLCLMAIQSLLDCSARHEYNYAQAASVETLSRKILAGYNVRQSFHAENFVSREMRMVPSGPDPLHHNGGSPKKPRTP